MMKNTAEDFLLFCRHTRLRGCIRQLCVRSTV